MYRVYLHRDINGVVFYVGCTKGKNRPYERYYNNCKGRYNLRSKRWYERCCNVFEVSIYADNLTKDEAYEKEKELIAFYGRELEGGVLVNISSGGPGASGCKYEYTKERTEKITLVNRKTGEARREKTLQAIYDCIEDWDFEGLGKITMVKISEVVKVSDKTVKNYLRANPELKTYIKELNSEFKALSK